VIGFDYTEEVVTNQWLEGCHTLAAVAVNQFAGGGTAVDA
jgi:hypothetical protein